MSGTKRDEVLSAFATRIFDSMVNDIVMDIALQTHNETLRSRSVCDVCHTRCGSVHVPPSGAGSRSSAVSRQNTPVPSPSKSGATNGAGTPNGREKGDANVMFECTNCKRPIASTRFASHLSGCLGLPTGSRRAAARNASARTKLSADGRSASPYVNSDVGAGFSDDEVSPAKPKGKAKGAKASSLAAELNGKRALLDDSPSPKKKKVKTSNDSNSPLANGLPTYNSQTRTPSKLRPSPPIPIVTYSQSRSADSSPDSASSPESVQPSPLQGKTVPRAGKTSTASSVPPRLLPVRKDADYIDVDGGDSSSSDS